MHNTTTDRNTAESAKILFTTTRARKNTVREEGKRATITIICTLIVHRALKEFGETY